MKVLVIHGPNLDLLGHREPSHYGRFTVQEIDALLADTAASDGIGLECRQSNREGVLVEWLHEAIPRAEGGGGKFDAVVMNPAGYSHTSVALRDAVTAAVQAGVPVVEVHISNVHDREDFRHALLTGAKASGVIAGFAEESYVLGLWAAARLAKRNDRTREGPTP